jgi:hypothetical protein
VSPTEAGAVGQCEAPRVTEPRNGGNRIWFMVWRKKGAVLKVEIFSIKDSLFYV